MADLVEAADQRWDAIIIGTGIGGATLGFALARSGWRVLFCEKGVSQIGQRRWRGDYAEVLPAGAGLPCSERRLGLAQAGRYSETIEDYSRTPAQNFVPFIGSGTGGSSALYGMAMERFFPLDFRPRNNYPDARETSLPEMWPISYEELAPYYTLAEALFRVCGTGDPLRTGEPREHFRPPPPLTPQGSALCTLLQRQGLHPYRVPMACEFVPGCQCCQGYLCPHDCKNDGTRVCLQPALAVHGARLLDECKTLRLEATRSKVTEVVCHWRGKEIRLRGKVIMLAAGALASPEILLKSASSLWPDGLANDSGLVGKNLMRHFSDLYAVFLRGIEGQCDNRRKEIAFNDFYHVDGKKLGNVQSFGRLPPAQLIADSLQRTLANRAAWAAPLFRVGRPAIDALLRRMVDRAAVLATVVEDLPYADNRVTLVAGAQAHSRTDLAITYRIRPDDLARIRALRGLMKKALKPTRFMLLKQAENNEMIAHACGTCRFGLDPTRSVLDRNNRAHDLDNLYVVDSSFFPSSGGTNPSLTIAANALRIATHLGPNPPRDG